MRSLAIRLRSGEQRAHDENHLVIYAGVGHLPVIEAPERVAADLTALGDTVGG